MNRRDVLTSFREGQNRGPNAGRDSRGRPTADVRIELDPSEHEEPTWEVHRPGAPRRRFDKRARAILTAAAVAALLANAGAAWTYWRFNGPDERQPQVQPAAVGAPFDMVLTGTSGADGSGDLTVTVTNQHPVPIQITAVRPGAGPVRVDDAHRDAGCSSPRVQVTREVHPVSWEVPRNTVGAFVLENALSVRAGGPAACRGATFSVSVQAKAVR